MKVFSVPKHSGGVRTIYAPDRAEKRELRQILSTIAQPLVQLKSAHGFMPGRNIVTNATPHVEKNMTISIDLSNFFDSVVPAMVMGKIPAVCLEKCFPGGAARQGLPTSPAIANLAASGLDEAIRKRLQKMQIAGWVYTRYADDLSISSDVDDQATAEKIIAEVRQIVCRCGFKMNDKKTRIQRSSAGRREVCGLTVDESVHIPRRMARKLRAARHNYVRASKAGADKKELSRLERKFVGLLEFSLLKQPVEKTEADRAAAGRISDAQKIASEYNLRAPQPGRKVIPDQALGSAVCITTDPAMIYGMSAYTTGWTSCMSITRSTHTYRKGVAFWQRLSGCALAYIAGEGTTTVAGVRRPKMQARCLIYALRDGRKAYGDIYSGAGHRMYGPNEHALAVALSEQGFVPATECRGALVAGNVRQPCPLPFFDNAHVETVTLSESKTKAYRVRLR